MSGDFVEHTGFTQDQLVVYKLGVLESKIDGINEKLDAKEKAQDETLKEHDRRLEVIEGRFKWFAGGAAAFLLVFEFIRGLPWQNLL